MRPPCYTAYLHPKMTVTPPHGGHKSQWTPVICEYGLQQSTDYKYVWQTVKVKLHRHNIATYTASAPALPFTQHSLLRFQWMWWGHPNQNYVYSILTRWHHMHSILHHRRELTRVLQSKPSILTSLNKMASHMFQHIDKAGSTLAFQINFMSFADAKWSTWRLLLPVTNHACQVVLRSIWYNPVGTLAICCTIFLSSS